MGSERFLSSREIVLTRMALGFPLRCSQQALARLTTRFLQVPLWLRSALVRSRFHATESVADGVAGDRFEHDPVQQIANLRWGMTQRILECGHRLQGPLEAQLARLLVVRLGRL